MPLIHWFQVWCRCDAGVMQGMHRFVGACKINLKVYLDDAKE